MTTRYLQGAFLAVMLSFSMLAAQAELQPTVANFDARFVRQAHDVMALLRIPESCSWQNCSSWHFPPSKSDWLVNRIASP